MVNRIFFELDYWGIPQLDYFNQNNEINLKILNVLSLIETMD